MPLTSVQSVMPLTSVRPVMPLTSVRSVMPIQVTLLDERLLTEPANQTDRENTEVVHLSDGSFLLHRDDAKISIFIAVASNATDDQRF